MASVELRDIRKSYASLDVIHGISLDITDGEFIALVGPSGCGKSTLLRMIAGLEEITDGDILIGGTVVNSMTPRERNIAMVFQSYALFPHMSVAKNLGFGLKIKKVPKDERARRIAHALEICNLTGLVDRMPRQLSGGQQQRVALARAIVMQPSLLLFDEPLSNLDAKLRDTLRHELTELHRRIGATSLYVTHDQAEAMAMSDRIVVMNAGRVVEVGTPLELYRAPKHAFTAGFLGQTNLLPVLAEGRQAQLPWEQSVTLDATAAGSAQISVRPENIHISADEAGAGTVSAVSFMGANALYTVEIGSHQIKISQSGAENLIDAGRRVALRFPGSVHLLDDGQAGEAA